MILCIDDEPGGLEARKRMLETQGYKVITALSGPEGLALFAIHRIEAVILDYAMPEMNGGEVAREIKLRYPDVKVLLLSAYVDLPEEALRWVDKRAIKGVSPKTLLIELDQLLSA